MHGVTRRAVLTGMAAAAGVAAGPWVLRSAAQAGPIKVGLVLPYTGVYAVLGESITQAMELVFARENWTVAGRKIEMIKEDDEMKPPVGVRKTEKLIDSDRVDILTGPVHSGILMGMGVGAAAINMGEYFVTLPFYPPATTTFGIFVNAFGQRFINEDCYHGRIGWYALQQPGERIYLIIPAEDFERPTYLNADIAGTGETVEELEAELGLPAGMLVHTVNYYNAHAAKGEDPVFHKSAEWLKPLEGAHGER